MDSNKEHTRIAKVDDVRPGKREQVSKLPPRVWTRCRTPTCGLRGFCTCLGIYGVCIPGWGFLAPDTRGIPHYLVGPADCTYGLRGSRQWAYQVRTDVIFNGIYPDGKATLSICRRAPSRMCGIYAADFKQFAGKNVLRKA